MRNFIKEQKGITLIALVITIIVLLILAGVGMSMITSENGLMQQASTAKNKTNEASIQERIELAYMSARTNKEAKVDIDILNDELDEIEENSGTVATFPATVTIKGQQYTISEKGEVTKGNGGGENTPAQPQVGEWVSYLAGGINKWRVIDEVDGKYVLAAKITDLKGSFEASGKSNKTEYLNTFVVGNLASEAEFINLDGYIEAMTGKEIPDLQLGGPVTGEQVTEEELLALGISKGEVFLKSINSSMTMADFYSIEVGNDGKAGYRMQISNMNIESNLTACIKVTLESGVVFEGEGTESSPYTVTASNS